MKQTSDTIAECTSLAIAGGGCFPRLLDFYLTPSPVSAAYGFLLDARNALTSSASVRPGSKPRIATAAAATMTAPVLTASSSNRSSSEIPAIRPSTLTDSTDLLRHAEHCGWGTDL